MSTAQNWAEDSTDMVVAEVVTLVTSEVTGASLFSGIIASQIADLLSWEFSEPVNATEQIYEIDATVSTRISLDLPLLGTKTYEARLPIDLQVDVSTGSVAKWSADFANASVGEIEPTS